MGLPVRIGAAWPETIQQLFNLRCMPEDSPLFEAMDCPSDFTLGPFSASGPEGDGLTIYSDDGLTVTRVTATSENPQRCDAFQVSVAHALATVGVQSHLENNHEGLQLRAGGGGDLLLTVECSPKGQFLELADVWLEVVPRGNCPVLASAPPKLRELADTAMTKVIHENWENLGTACNRPGFAVNEFAGQIMAGLMVAYRSMGLQIPKAPPDWLVGQILEGLADARNQGAALPATSRRRFGVYLDRETSRLRLARLWAGVSKNLDLAQSTEPAQSTPHAKGSTGKHR